MTIIYQLLQFYWLICMRIQRFIFVITVKASALVIRLAIRAFTDKFRRSINRFYQVALNFLLLVLTVDVGGSEIGMSNNIVSITLQPALTVFFPIGNSFMIKDAV